MSGNPDSSTEAWFLEGFDCKPWGSAEESRSTTHRIGTWGHHSFEKENYIPNTSMFVSHAGIRGVPELTRRSSSLDCCDMTPQILSTENGHNGMKVGCMQKAFVARTKDQRLQSWSASRKFDSCVSLHISTKERYWPWRFLKRSLRNRWVL